MQKGSKVAIVCCSNGQPLSNKMVIDQLIGTLECMGLVPVLSSYIYDRNLDFCGTGRERAEVLLSFYKDKDIQAIFDISGGDLANEVLSFLDFDVIKENPKPFFGYSDLTTIINAIYAKTGMPSVLYQVRNLVYEDGKRQRQEFAETFLETEQTKKPIMQFQYEWIQGEKLEGVVVGGNIRCLLKLAGTPYWPDMKGKVLLLEARGGLVPQMVTYLNQLKQMGVFLQVNGILLGTFTKMEEEGCIPSMTDLIKEYAPGLPIVKTNEIGHGMDSKAIVIGREILYERVQI